ncbi:MAG: pyridoxamine 5'-phosphate oxidase family protein [Candidatus Omnitrophota bacterium]|jgi:general stress protein 26|nr:pyridoxamine 5'-phosphate oxidase family protein [Candidatus Omnitrophota bacterium]
MEQIPSPVADFLSIQGFVIVSSIDKNGFPHISCKDIVKIDASGEVYLIDVHQGLTVENIRRNPQVSISAVDEPKFMGYCLKGRAVVIPEHKINQEFIKAWEDNITSRLSKRLLYNLTQDKPRGHHPEAKLPRPKHLIIITVEEIVDLTPGYLRKD